MTCIAVHTPTPWRHRATHYLDYIKAERDGLVEVIFSGEIDTANATHIVRCVNNHDALVAALRNARAQVRALGTPDDAVNNAVLAECDSAIAAAELS